jgi:hypothetical protein
MNANRQITGTLRGFDQFMNLVLDGTVDVKNKVDIGMVVSKREEKSSLGRRGLEMGPQWTSNILLPALQTPLLPSIYPPPPSSLRLCVGTASSPLRH